MPAGGANTLEDFIDDDSYVMVPATSVRQNTAVTDITSAPASQDTAVLDLIC